MYTHEKESAEAAAHAVALIYKQQAHHLEQAATLRLRRDGPAEREDRPGERATKGETFGLRAATKVGGVAGKEISSADGEVELGRGVGRKVHCGVQKVGVILLLIEDAAFSLG